MLSFSQKQVSTIALFRLTIQLSHMCVTVILTFISNMQIYWPDLKSDFNKSWFSQAIYTNQGKPYSNTEGFGNALEAVLLIILG